MFILTFQLIKLIFTNTLSKRFRSIV